MFREHEPGSVAANDFLPEVIELFGCNEQCLDFQQLQMLVWRDSMMQDVNWELRKAKKTKFDEAVNSQTVYEITPPPPLILEEQGCGPPYPLALPNFQSVSGKSQNLVDDSLLQAEIFLFQILPQFRQHDAAVAQVETQEERLRTQTHTTRR